jgi:acetyl-CoA C-acetyltransferase
MAEAYIVAATRTAGGRRGGRLAGWHPADLAAQVIDALVAKSGIDPAAVEDVILGCVSQVGEQASNVARNAVLASKLPESVPGTSVDRQCGSSQQALHFAAQAVMAGSMDAVIAGGVESMTRVPMYSPNALPAKAGLGTFMSPAMQGRYPGVEFSQFTGAEMIAKNYGITKEALDRYAFETHRRAIAATREGAFADEILPVEVRSSDDSAAGEMHRVDEGIRFDVTLEGIAGVKLIASEIRQGIDRLAVDGFGMAGLQLPVQRPFYGDAAPPSFSGAEAQVAAARYLNSRSWSIFGGTSEIQLSIIAKAALGL